VGYSMGWFHHKANADGLGAFGPQALRFLVGAAACSNNALIPFISRCLTLQKHDVKE
jgi:hypothetical protein